MEPTIFEKAIILDLPALVEYSANGIVSKRVLEKKTGNIRINGKIRKTGRCRQR